MNLNVNDHELLIVQMFKMYHNIIADNTFASKQYAGFSYVHL